MLTVEQVLAARDKLEENKIYKVYFNASSNGVTFSGLNLEECPMYGKSRTFGVTYAPSDLASNYPLVPNYQDKKLITPYRVLKFVKVVYDINSRIKLVPALNSLNYVYLGCLDQNFDKLKSLDINDLIQNSKVKVFNAGNIYASKSTIQKLYKDGIIR